MTPQQLANLLTNKDSKETIPDLLIREAKAHNLVIAWTDDDRWYLSGSIQTTIDSSSASDFILVSKHGISWEFDEIDCSDKDALRTYFQHEREWAMLEAEWNSVDDYHLAFSMASPHATFELTNSNDPFCRGIVFSLDELVPSEVE